MLNLTKKPGDLELWLVYDGASGRKKRYLAKKWIYRGAESIATPEEIETDNVEEIRKDFFAKGYKILPKKVGIVIDIWEVPEEVRREA